VPQFDEGEFLRCKNCGVLFRLEQGHPLSDCLMALKHKAANAIACRDAMETEKEEQRVRANRLSEVLKDFRDNYDHDADAHKNGTPCRVCTATDAIGPKL
jgi:hypothetical protein